ncbi:hypothetical protein [Pseudobacteroides cellulosolvens]|uniref:Uncharacterized protein n=1 Tax=Pseudobacteroides cellulosolvens ATCC 35603 = DSM 2933 TaxID=398512 RepID=A0A0L6JVE1_9FIRM|nr:hypothetical protein [Pseudobacteroides cellulosolvens]KNY29821.1 hypothetical protein Bccel_5098 [Pseudobacteroides cellulosolvens ATCC 35603 = DSM 2933]
MDNKALIKELVKLEIMKTRLIMDILPGQVGRYAKEGFDSIIDAVNEVTKEYAEKRPKEEKTREGGINRVKIE